MNVFDGVKEELRASAPLHSSGGDETHRVGKSAE